MFLKFPNPSSFQRSRTDPSSFNMEPWQEPDREKLAAITGCNQPLDGSDFEG